MAPFFSDCKLYYRQLKKSLKFRLRNKFIKVGIKYIKKFCSGVHKIRQISF